METENGDQTDDTDNPNDDPCCFTVDNTYVTDQLLLESAHLSLSHSRFCCNPSTSSPSCHSLTRWNPCDNHDVSEMDLALLTGSGSNDCGIAGLVDNRDDSKKRILHRFPVTGLTLPFGHETLNRKNEYVFRHHGRLESHMEQYRYNNTYGGTGRKLRDAEIAQTLLGMMKNGQIRFPIISAHDTNLVGSVSQFASSTVGSIRARQTTQSTTKKPSYSLSSYGNDSVVLPKMTDTTSLVKYVQLRNADDVDGVKRKKRGKTKRYSGNAQLVEDYRRFNETDLETSTSYWWYDDMPFVGKKMEKVGHSGDKTSRSADSALLCGKSSSKRSKRNMLSKSVGSMPNSGELVPEIVQDILNSRGKIATKENIKCLMNLFAPDEDISPRSHDDRYIKRTAETYALNDNAKGYGSVEYAGGTHHRRIRMSNSKGGHVANKLAGIESGSSKILVKGVSRTCDSLKMRQAMQGNSTNGVRHTKPSTRTAIPLSKDTILLGAPYRTEEEHLAKLGVKL